MKRAAATPDKSSGALWRAGWVICVVLALAWVLRPTAFHPTQPQRYRPVSLQEPSGNQPVSPLDAAARALEQSTESESQPEYTPDTDAVPSPGIIRAFFNSWTLFHNTYLSGWLIAATLAMVGVLVVARNQIFIGAAVSQASMLGVAAGLCASGLIAGAASAWLQSDYFLSGLAVASSVIAALLTARSGRAGAETTESITGWVFLICASASVVVVTHSPHGLEEVHRLLSSSIIGSTSVDVVVFAVLTALTAMGAMMFGRRLLLCAMDAEMAAAVGLRTSLWAAMFCIWLGLTVGLSVRAAGMLYSFGMLVLPALIAKNLCKEISPMFIISPIVATTIATIGFMLANKYDYPPAQMTVVLLGLCLFVVWTTERIRSARPAPKPA